MSRRRIARADQTGEHHQTHDPTTVPISTQIPDGQDRQIQPAATAQHPLPSQQRGSTEEDGETLQHLPEAYSAERPRDESEFNPERVYGYSRLACRGSDGFVTLNPEEALIGRFIAYKVRRSKNIRDDRKWFFKTTHELSAGRYPWIPDSTLARHLKNLKRKGVLLVGKYNRKGYDRTRWYSLNENWMDLLDKDIISFRAGDAIDFGGICEATLLRNLTHWTQKSACEDGEITARRFSPTALSRLLPFSLATIKRALDRLEAKGAIKKTRIDGQRTSSYALDETLEQRIKIPSGGAVTNPKMEHAPSSFGDSRIAHGATMPHQSGSFETHRFEALRNLNSGALEGLPLGVRAKAAAMCKSLCGRIIGNIEDGDLSRYLSARSPDELLAVSIRLCEDAKVDPGMLNLCSEMLFHALKPPGWHLQQPQLEGSYELLLLVCGRRQNYVKELKRQNYEHDRLRFASPDAHREGQHELAPAAKVRILRNGITARNKFGFLDSNNDRKTDRIAVTKEGLTIAEEFFVLNTQWSAGDVLGLLEHCAQLDDNPPDGGYDELWHARRGRNLGFLMKNLDTVVNRLGLSASLPCFVMPAPVESDPPTAAPLPAEP